MTDEPGAALTVTEFIEYCQTQAGLLTGRVQTMRADADTLLTEIDADIETLRTRLENHSTTIERPPAPPTPDHGATPEEDTLESLEALERDLKEKQTIVKAKQARIHAFEELATAYTALAADLDSSVETGMEAMKRVIAFERDADAPAYFEEQTVAEAAANASPDDDS